MFRSLISLSALFLVAAVAFTGCGNNPTTSNSSPLSSEFSMTPQGKSGFACNGGWTNPCNGEFVTFDGACKNMYQVNATASGNHHVIHFKWAGSGLGSNGNEYNLSLVGNAQPESGVDVGGGTTLFEAPYRATIAGSGQTFFSTGTVNVWVNNETIVGIWISALQSECALDTPAS